MQWTEEHDMPRNSVREFVRVHVNPHVDLGVQADKMWIINGMQADWMCALVNTGDGNLHSNKSLIISPVNTPGAVRARKLDKFGMRSSDAAEICLDGVRVPNRYRVGRKGLVSRTRCSSSRRSDCGGLRT